jgi:acyl-CoA synthetase (AMP-forming)/AMP-acid ligase II
MPDVLTTYAQLQPDKLAVVDDRLGVDVRTVTFAELEAVTNQLAHVLLAHGAAPGVKVVWCGQNSLGIAALTVAARKCGVTAVPLNYRLSDEEAAYVTDHSDATIVYVDSEYAPLFERIRAEIPKVTDILVFDGPAPSGMTAVDELIAAASTEPPPDPAATADTGATMIYTSGTTGKP